MCFGNCIESMVHCLEKLLYNQIVDGNRKKNIARYMFFIKTYGFFVMSFLA